MERKPLNLIPDLASGYAVVSMAHSKPMILIGCNFPSDDTP